MSFLPTLPYSPFLEWIEANRDQTFFHGLFRLAKDLAQLSASHPSAGSSSRHEHRGRKVGSSSPVLSVPVQALLLTRNIFWNVLTDPRRCQWQRASDGTRPSPPLCSSPLTSTYRSGSPCPRSSRTLPPLPPRPSMGAKGGGSTTILLGRERRAVGR